MKLDIESALVESDSFQRKQQVLVLEQSSHMICTSTPLLLLG